MSGSWTGRWLPLYRASRGMRRTQPPGGDSTGRVRVTRPPERVMPAARLSVDARPRAKPSSRRGKAGEEVAVSAAAAEGVIDTVRAPAGWVQEHAVDGPL